MNLSTLKLAALLPIVLPVLPSCTSARSASVAAAVETTSGGKTMDELNYEVFIAATDLADGTTVTATEKNTELKVGHFYDIGVYVFAKSDLGLRFRTIDAAGDARAKSCPVVETNELQVGTPIAVVVCDLTIPGARYNLSVSWWKDQTVKASGASGRIDGVVPALARGELAELSVRDFTSAGPFQKIAAADLGTALKAGGAYEFQLKILDSVGNVLEQSRDPSEVDSAGGGQCVFAKVFNYDPAKETKVTLAACDLNDSSVFKTATVVVPAAADQVKVSAVQARFTKFVPALDAKRTPKLSFRALDSGAAFKDVALADLAGALQDAGDYELKLAIVDAVGNVLFQSRDASEVSPDGQGKQCLPAKLSAFDANAATELTLSACNLDDSSIFETATLLIPAADGSSTPAGGGGVIIGSSLKAPVTVTGGKPLKDLGYKVLITYTDQATDSPTTTSEEAVQLTQGHRYQISASILVATDNRQVFSTLDDGSARAKKCPSVFATAQAGAPINFTVCDLGDQTAAYDVSLLWGK